MGLGALGKWVAGSSLGGLGKNPLLSKFGIGEDKTKSTSTDPNLKNRNYMVLITQDQELNGGTARVIVGTVPQSFQIQQNVDWKAPWGGGLADGAIGNILAVGGNRLVAQVMTMQVWQGSGNDFEFTVTFELRAWSDPVKDVLDPLRTLLKMSLPQMKENGFLQSPGPILDGEGVKTVSGQVVSGIADAYTAGSKAATNAGSTLNGQTTVATLFEQAKAGASAAAGKLADSGLARKGLIENQLKHKINIQIGQWFKLKNVVITQVQHDIKGQTPDRNSGVIQSATVSVSFKPMFAITADDVESMLMAGSRSS